MSEANTQATTTTNETTNQPPTNDGQTTNRNRDTQDDEMIARTLQEQYDRENTRAAVNYPGAPILAFDPAYAVNPVVVVDSGTYVGPANPGTSWTACQYCGRSSMVPYDAEFWQCPCGRVLATELHYRRMRARESDDCCIL
eukprot:c8498_g1_i1.p1 GENE.c8498_g1_i1~~c8498_g1_i1.p1  ORF type:complete len:153 (-),score=29.58 c8498_g1_i1:222-644(-)